MKIISVVKKIINKLIYGSETLLHAHEATSICVFQEQLSNENKEVLGMQFNKLDVFQRSPDGKVVTFFDSGDQYFKHWSDDVLFENRDEAKVISKITLEILNPSTARKNAKLKVEVMIHEGHFAALYFNKKPSDIYQPQEHEAVLVSEVLLCKSIAGVKPIGSKVLM